MTVSKFPKERKPSPLPKEILRPCDAMLLTACSHLEAQLGTVEAYNRLVRMATHLHSRIKRGDIKAQNPLYALDPRGKK